MPKRHEFVCEDVIYLRDRHKKAVVANVATVVVIGSAMWIYGTYCEKKEQRNLRKAYSQ